MVGSESRRSTDQASFLRCRASANPTSSPPSIRVRVVDRRGSRRPRPQPVRPRAACDWPRVASGARVVSSLRAQVMRTGTPPSSNRSGLSLSTSRPSDQGRASSERLERGTSNRGQQRRTRPKPVRVVTPGTAGRGQHCDTTTACAHKFPVRRPTEPGGFDTVSARRPSLRPVGAPERFCSGFAALGGGVPTVPGV